MTRATISWQFIYLPEGSWVDYFSGELYEGNCIDRLVAKVHKRPRLSRREGLSAAGWGALPKNDVNLVQALSKALGREDDERY